MRARDFYLFTTKDIPSDASLPSHQWLIRAGMIKKLASGLYTWMPLGLRVLQKVQAIVRKHMNAAGALEMLMPNIQPRSLWDETGRFEKYGPMLLKMQDRHAQEYCFGPTHEEVVTHVVGSDISSYKQLPINVYQIQTKFRDEIRPRFGLMRAREFLMKDAYSFHTSMDCLEKTYQTMYQTYAHILQEIGLDFRAVEADSGEIGGDGSHEFHVLAQSGEDLIAYCKESAYCANIEKAYDAQALELAHLPAPVASESKMQKVATPGMKSIEAVASFLCVEPQRVLKSLIVRGREHPFVMVLLCGDDTLNEVKAGHHPLIQSPLQFASDAEIQKVMHCSAGSLGPVQTSLPIVADLRVKTAAYWHVGANEDDHHFLSAGLGIDFHVQTFSDVRQVQEGDLSPCGSGPLALCRGIEVGHIFQLGSSYARALNALYTDAQGQQHPMVMGCYGIGVSRLVAASIEQNHDEKGILWPKAIAPFHIHLLALNAQKSELTLGMAEALYESLGAHTEVLLDDRDIRPGPMFKDADLLGIPFQLILGEKGLSENRIELKSRDGGFAVEIALAPIEQLTQTILKHIQAYEKS